MDKEATNNIKNIRKTKGYSQLDIAEKLHISQSAYSKIELGKTKIDNDYLNRIAAALQVDISELTTTELTEELKENPNISLDIKAFAAREKALLREIELLKQIIQDKTELIELLKESNKTVKL